MGGGLKVIDLGDYPTWVTRHIKNQKMACVYVISYPEGRPSKIGYAQDISARFGAIQACNAHVLSLEFVIWLADVRYAQLVEQTAQMKLQNMQVRGEWFDIHAEVAAQVIRESARANNFRGDIMIEHDDLIKKLEENGIKRKLDRRRKKLPQYYVPPPRFVRG